MKENKFENIKTQIKMDMNNVIRTEEQRLNYLNEELGTNYQSLDKVYWRTISACKTLSEDFIREFKDKVYWGIVCQFQHLSEDFIREFQDRVDWKVISFKKRLSEDFIKEFADRFNE